MDEKETVPLLDRLASLLSFFLRLICVPKCIICKTPLIKDSNLCPDCRRIWKKARNKKCPVCQKTARACKCRPFSLIYTDMLGERKISALAFYNKFGSEEEEDILVRKYIFRIKRGASRACVRVAARELSHEILRSLIIAKEDPKNWKLTYAPRSAPQKRKYGFDQGLELARSVSKFTGMPLEKAIVNRGARAQKSLNAKERKLNADSSYILRKNYKPTGNYIIIDDVITTGATVDRVANLLKANGACKVFPACIARSKKKKRKVRRPSDRPWFSSVKRY